MMIVIIVTVLIEVRVRQRRSADMIGIRTAKMSFIAPSHLDLY